MKKSSFLLLILMLLIVSAVIHFNSHLGLIAHNQPIHENTKGFLKFPQLGDLYVISNQKIGYISFFRIAGNPTNEKIYIASGFSSEPISSIKSPEKLFNLMINNDRYLGNLIIKSKTELNALANDSINILSIYRQVQRTPLTLSGLFYNTPLGFFGTLLAILLFLWGLKSTFLLSKKQSIFLSHPNIIYCSLGFTTLLFIAFFLMGKIFLFLWGLILLFYIFSILPVTYLFHYFNRRSFSKMDFWDGEINKFFFLFIIGFLLQSVAYSVMRAIYDASNSFFLENFFFPESLGISSFALAALISWFIIASLNFLYNFNQRFLSLRQTKKALDFAKQKELQSQAELDALQARVNPHFLYNSLNSIAGLAQEDPAKTEEMAIALSHFFKYSTNRQTENWSTIEKEIEILETYLEIEKIRFGKRLQFQLTCPDDLLTIQTPRFLLQPIVENAIKYGYDQATNSIAIQINIQQNGNQLVFQIYDGGKPFPDNMPSGYGLQSIRKKLTLLYPARHELAFINAPKKQVAITLEI